MKRAAGRAKAPARLEHRVLVSRRGARVTGVAPATIRTRAERMLGALGAELGAARVELSVALVDDATIRELNGRWRAKDKPTDVLAFPQDQAPAHGGARMLGDVILSLDTAKRQAKTNARRLLDELTMLLAHGLLHLLGYDHQNDRQERVMSARTAELERAARARGGGGR